MPQVFELFVFSTNPEYVQYAISAGVTGVVIDWEYMGKEDRQANADTQINRDTLDDLIRVRRATQACILCRINGLGRQTEREVESAIDGGASEILVPMVRSAGDVEGVLEQVRGRCGVGILIETQEAVRNAESFSSLPLSRVYMGLNDLAIARGRKNIFLSLSDGTVESIRHFFNVRFGFGGLTLPEFGHPIPCRLFLGEMIRLNCDFTFLRRSFLRDTRGLDLIKEVPRIYEAIKISGQRSSQECKVDHEALLTAIQNWPEGSTEDKSEILNPKS